MGGVKQQVLQLQGWPARLCGMANTEVRTVGGLNLEVLTTNSVVIGTGSAGFCAATRLVDFGQDDVVIVTDKTKAGTSRNAGSDKQTYYKLTLAGSEPDSVREMANTLFSGGAMDGDNALAEAALSARAFLHLCDIGVPFPRNEYGEFVGYKTDHDPRQRATSVGPYTSRSMVEALESEANQQGITVISECRVVDLIVADQEVIGVLLLRRDRDWDPADPPFLLVRCTNVVYATGGPAMLYANSVFPHGQWGASGAGYRAGAVGKNVTEWQFGLASVRPRWNVSGSYMQVVPRFISTEPDGSDPREFLLDAIGDRGRLASLVFLKGYQWPFDIRKAREGSSVIDLLVYRETQLRGRRVYLDFMHNVADQAFTLDDLEPEARSYLERAGAVQGSPIKRLMHMNRPAYDFYLEKGPKVDLATEMLEVDVCAQHNNGGFAVDSWWRSNLEGFFPVGEAAGSHGVYRPGGSALNSGQVGATRAAEYIAKRRTQLPGDDSTAFETAAAQRVAEALELVEAAASNAAGGTQLTPLDLLRQLSELMSVDAGPVRSTESIDEVCSAVTQWLAELPRIVAAAPNSRRLIDRLFLLRDALTTAFVYTAAMQDFAGTNAGSRGSVLYSDDAGSFPVEGDLDQVRYAADRPGVFKFRLSGPELDATTQEVRLIPTDRGEAPQVGISWRAVRPIPSENDFFENVWRQYRQSGGVPG